MRVMLSFMSDMDIAYSAITKHTIQGWIYHTLRGTNYEQKHDQKGFKFFTFSDIFPSSKVIKSEEVKNLIISSPDSEFIKTIYDKLEELTEIKLGPYLFRVVGTKIIQLKPSKSYITGSPIVLYKSNYDGSYFSFKRDGDLKFFLRRLRDNAVKKYRAFYGVDYNFENPIFDRLVFRKEVALPVTLKTKRFIVIGSLWRELSKVGYTKEERHFYSFIMDCGLGEKNSLGFGFINPKIKKDDKHDVRSS